MNNPVLIFGAGSLGKTALDIFNGNDVLIYGILDDNKELHGQEFGGVSVLGETEDGGFLKLIGKKTQSFVAVRNQEDRDRLAKMLNTKRKVMPVSAIHKSSSVSEDAAIGHGNLISAGSVIGGYAQLGNLCVVGANAVVDAEAAVGDLVDIGPGSVIGSKAVIGNGVFIGTNVTVVSGIKIGEGARIGAGSVVIEDVEEGKTVFGNPAKVMS
ncbi:NeuD/PglB/VioB family sugar acetyltransferase [Jiulongibacter sp. NS-SX5]|uniref:NeuD/PglB/VioB family sugar acetyltransferase n=1 Tax=Jiulongibacter sp. NS-SX5 TaxID=3463854 RepID=UPI0040596D42